MKQIIKRLSFFPVLLLCLTLLCGCTTNNGDIGNLYGTWALEAVDIDGTPQTAWQEDGKYFVNWQFQNNIVEISRFDILHSSITSVGTWTRDDETMTFDFTHYDDDNPAGTGIYAAPSWILFPDGVTSFSVLKSDNKNLVLSTTLADGRRLTYSLRKTM